MEIGDIVALKSDLSVYMTIENFYLSNNITYVSCVWLDTENKLQRADFDKRILAIVENNY